MISSINSQLTSSIGTEYYQTFFLFSIYNTVRTHLLALEFTSSRMTLETPRKQTARTTIGIKMKRNKQKNKHKTKNRLEKKIILFKPLHTSYSWFMVHHLIGWVL